MRIENHVRRLDVEVQHAVLVRVVNGARQRDGETELARCASAARPLHLRPASALSKALRLAARRSVLDARRCPPVTVVSSSWSITPARAPTWRVSLVRMSPGTSMASTSAATARHQLHSVATSGVSSRPRISVTRPPNRPECSPCPAADRSCAAVTDGRRSDAVPDRGSPRPAPSGIVATAASSEEMRALFLSRPPSSADRRHALVDCELVQTGAAGSAVVWPRVSALLLRW